MINFAKILATVGGIGYIPKGGGTMASMVYCLVWVLLPDLSLLFQVVLLIFVLTAGVWSATILEKNWGKDNNRVVIDELAGMIIALLTIPVKLKFVLIALVLFRFFDILKPLGIRRLEKLPVGWGVMADDVLSGFYSLVILQLAIKVNLI
ncbi:MAG: phosphatidylglycerophosphatase A [Ginsengibacter sp.]